MNNFSCVSHRLNVSSADSCRRVDFGVGWNLPDESGVAITARKIVKAQSVNDDGVKD